MARLLGSGLNVEGPYRPRKYPEQEVAPEPEAPAGLEDGPETSPETSPDGGAPEAPEAPQDAPEQPEQEQKQEVESEQEPGVESEREVEPEPEEFPANLKRKDHILEWVEGGDVKSRAKLAIEAENTRPEKDRRKTLLSELDKLVKKSDDNDLI